MQSPISNHNNASRQLTIAQLTNPRTPSPRSIASFSSHHIVSLSLNQSPSPPPSPMTKHTKDDYFLRTFTLQHHKLPIDEFKTLLHTELTLHEGDYLYIKLLSCHCIYNIFILHDLHQEYTYDHDVHLLYITKQRAYECFQNFYRLFYTSIDDDSYIKMPGFGKLIKGLYNGKVITKRVGSRARSNYCFSNLWVKDHIWDALKQNGADVRADSVLLRTKQSKIWIIYDLFIANKQLPVQASFTNDLERDLYNSMVRCDDFYDHFVRTILLNGVGINDATNRALLMLINDWKEINVPEILKQNLKADKENDYFLLRLFQTILALPNLFETILNQNFTSVRTINSDEQIQNLKRGMIEILTNIHKLSKKLVKPRNTSTAIDSYNISDDSIIYLNFQFIMTAILRALTINQKASFRSYWILSCFIHEFIKLSIELEKLGGT